MSETHKIYLLRVGGQILGPYSTKDVEDLISEGFVSMNDEIIESCSHAFYLQDHPKFKSLIRSSYLKNRLSNIATSFSGRLSMITKKYKDTDSGLTETITQTSKTEKEEEAVEEAKDVDFQILETAEEDKNSSQYKTAEESESINQDKVQKIQKRLWQVIFLSTLVATGFIVFKVFFSDYQEKKNLIKQVQTQGVDFYNSGRYKASLKIFQKGFKNNILDQDQKKILIHLLLNQKKLEEAQSLLTDIENSLSQSELYFIKGLIAFHDSSYSSARKFFLEAEGDYINSGLLNLSFIDLAEKKYEGVLDKSNQLLFKGYQREIVFYLRTLALIKMGSYTTQIKQQIEKHLKKSPEYQQELSLLLSYLYMKEGNKDKAKKHIASLLDWDFNFYKQYYYDSLIPVDSLNWSLLLPYCKELFENYEDDYLITALYGVCHIQEGSQKRLGFQYIRQARNQKPKDHLMISLFSYSLIEQGSWSQADTNLDQIKKSSYKLFYILKAQSLEKKEQWNSALVYWQDLLEMDPYNLSALGGMAFNQFMLQDFSDMKVYKDRGLNAYPHYVRLLSLP